MSNIINKEQNIKNEAYWNRVKELFIPKGVSDIDIQIAIELSKEYDLSFAKKEIWILPYGNKSQIIVSRDGLLTIAHRTGQFNGMSTEFGYSKENKLLFAECTVWNKSMQYPVKCRVFLQEYTTGKNLWISKPHVMLQKVAEATCLRRAFNINGLYIEEELPTPTQVGQGPENKNGQYQPILKPVSDLPKLAEGPKAPSVELPKRGDPALAVVRIEETRTMDDLNFIERVIREERAWSPEEIKWLNDIIKKQKEKILNPVKEI